MHVDQSHGYTVSLYDVEEEHDSVADLELSNLIILQHILQLVCAQGPHAVSVLQAVLRDNLGIQLVELNEVRVAEAEVLE